MISYNKKIFNAVNKCTAKQSKIRTIQLVITRIDIRLWPRRIVACTHATCNYSAIMQTNVIKLSFGHFLNLQSAPKKWPKDSLITFVCINAL